MAPLPHRRIPLRRRRRPALQAAWWLLLVLGASLTAYVGYAFLDATVFQSYQSWRLDRAVEAAAASDTLTPAVTPVQSSSSAAVIRHAPIVPGAVLGRIEISRLGIDVVIAEGVDRRTLRRAVGHIPGTALPGEQGNVALTGHRDTFFRPLRNIQQGDEILVTTLQGSYRYRVESTQVVAPGDTYVLDDTGQAALTLVTCYPFYFVGPAPERFIVHALPL